MAKQLFYPFIGSRLTGALIGLLLVSVLAPARPAPAFTPQDPVVKAMVRKGAGFLTTAKHSFQNIPEQKFGADCLVGLALLAADEKPTNPKIAHAIAECQKKLAPGEAYSGNEMYAPCIALIFLVEVNKVGRVAGARGKYHKEIEKMLAYVLKRQQGSGAWGYSTEPKRGDTSQTQYGVLCLWAADRDNFNVPPQATADALNWLIRTQDVGGGWVYKGIEPSGGAARVKQGEPSGSLSAAGLGSVYIAANALGFSGLTKKDERDVNLPPDVDYYIPEEEKKKKDEKKGPRADLVNTGPLAETQKLGKGWFAKNWDIDHHWSPQWQYYYMYAVERLMTLKADAENDTNPEPQWYNQGVDYLRKAQGGNGAWSTASGSAGTSTAFAILFLTRMTKRQIDPLSLAEGRLKGTGKLPITGGILERNGKLYGEKIASDVTDIIGAINNADEELMAELISRGAEIKFDKDASQRSKQAAKLQQLLSHREYEPRMLAVRALSKARDFDNVPAFIYALSDPDPRVVKEASNALRYVSRKFDGVGLVDDPTDIQKQEAQRKWKEWFLSVRPDAVFFN